MSKMLDLYCKFGQSLWLDYIDRKLLARGDLRELLASLDSQINTAQLQLEKLQKLGIDLEHISGQLEQEGINSFAESYDQLLTSLKEKRFALARHYAD